MFFAGVLAAEEAAAQTRVWNGSGTNWTQASNWTPATLPNSTSDVELNLGSTELAVAAGQARDVYLGSLNGSVGTFNISAGADLTSRNSYIGHHAQGFGDARVEGSGSTWTGSAMYVGRAGDGELIISGGAVTNSSERVIGYDANSIGLVRVFSGPGAVGSWTGSSNLTVGRAGEGTLTIHSGALVSASTAIIGDLPGSKGTASVSGEDTFWNITSTLYVGDEGKGELEMLGGRVETFGTRVGYLAGSDGDLTIALNADFQSNGALLVGYQGSGYVQVDTSGDLKSNTGTIGGTATSDGEVQVQFNSSWVNSSWLTVSSGGVLYIPGGTVSNTYSVVDGSSFALRADVTLEGGGSWSNTAANASTGQSLIVGDQGWGKLTINNSTVTTTTATLGYYSTSNAEVVVEGATAQWNSSGHLAVGLDGDATLTIKGGATVRSLTGIVADNATSQSKVIIEGVGSKWEVTGTVAGAATSLYIGDANGSGTEGTVVVRNGGQLSVVAGEVVALLGKGILSGNGKVVGSVTNSATVAPGYVDENTNDNVLGTLQVQGNYQQNSAKLKIDLGSTGNDKLNVTGNVSFTPFFSPAYVEVSLVPGFYPASGSSFDILDWGGTLSGSSTLQLPALAAGLSWNTSQWTTNGIISITGTVLHQADLSNNGIIDAADLVLWEKRQLSEETRNAIRAAFGDVAPPAGAGLSFELSSNVPEPASCVLFLTAVFGFWLGCGRRAQS